MESLNWLMCMLGESFFALVCFLFSSVLLSWDVYANNIDLSLAILRLPFRGRPLIFLHFCYNNRPL
jgi:hypothetical protein